MARGEERARQRWGVRGDWGGGGGNHSRVIESSLAARSRTNIAIENLRFLCSLTHVHIPERGIDPLVVPEIAVESCNTDAAINIRSRGVMKYSLVVVQSTIPDLLHHEVPRGECLVNLMIEVRGRSLQLRCARHRRAAALAARRSHGQQEISQLA